jgi:energy-coupling factor transport system permease protein
VSVFTAYEGESALHRRNPVAKLVAHLVLTVVISLVFDPLTPLLYLAAAALVGRWLGGLRVRDLAVALLPFWALALSLVASNALLVAAPERTVVLWRWGPLTATLAGLSIGLSLAERSLAVAALSLLFVMTTDPTTLVRALIQQARLPARIGYSALAAYRFLPLLQSEYATIQMAHRVRGVGERSGPRGWWRRQRRLVIPLLAGAIRRAERVALAMDARAFGGTATRSHYRLVPFTRADLALIVGAVALALGLLLLSAWGGWLRLWDGSLGA